MATIKVLENMNTFEKEIHRGVIAATIRQAYPNREYPKNGLYVTLGGLYTDKRGNLVPGSEIEHILNLGWNPKNIVNVDCDKTTVDRNNTNKDPRCKGIKNVYMPLTYKQKEGENCKVKFGETGGIVKVVKELLEAGEYIAALSPDLMQTVRIVGSVVTDLAYLLNIHQKQPCLMLTNFAANNRDRSRKTESGYYDVSDALWNPETSPQGTLTPLTFKQVAKNKWVEEVPTVNRKHGFGYTGGTMPMEMVSLSKNRGTVKYKIMVEKKKKKGDTDWVAAGKKAWKTRQQNRLSKRGIANEGRPELYDLAFCKGVAKRLMKGEYLKAIVREKGISYAGIRKAMERHALPTCHAIK